MPHVDTSSRLLRVLVGDDSQNWSTAVGTLVIGQDSVAENGLVLSTGTLTLQQNASNPESITPIDNAERWHLGVAISVQIENDSGAFVDHPQGALFILSEPDFDKTSRTLTLQVGCQLAWARSAEPADDVSAVALGTSTNLATVAQRYLEAADIAPSDLDLGTWPYSIATPVSKGDSTPYVDTAGACAYASDYRLLYCDSAGTVRTFELDTVAGTPDITLNLSTEELADGYIRYPDGQEPFEKIRVVGNGINVTTEVTPQGDSVTEGDLETLVESSYDLTEDEVIGRGVIAPVDPTRHASRRSRYQTKEPGEQVFEDGLGTGTRVVTDDTTDFLYYQATNDTTSDPGVFPYRFYYSFAYSERAAGLIDGGDSATVERYAERSVNYTHDAQGRVSKIVESEWRREKEFEGGSSLAWRKVFERIEAWTEVAPDLWEYQLLEREAAIVSKPDATYSPDSNKWNLKTVRAERRPARTPGENAPPATEEWDGPYNEVEVTYEGEATWQHRGGVTGRNRTRPPYQLPQGLAFSVAQCQSIAGKIRDLLDGRKRGYIIKLPISDALLALDRPLFQLRVTEPSERVVDFLCDAVTWEHQPRTAYVECLGILIADSNYP